MRHVAIGSIPRCQAPGIGTVPRELLRICHRIGATNQSDVPIVLEIGSGVAVSKAVRIESKIRVLREEERPAVPYSDIKLDSVVRMAVGVVIAVSRARPAGTVLKSPLALARPAGIIHLSGHPMGRRSNREQIRNHHLVEAD